MADPPRPSAPATAPPVQPVVLVGLTGSGKSTVGRRLARRLDRPFVDADDELARRSGRAIRDWFSEVGEADFRAAEADLLDDLLSASGPSVIAAGGGAVVTASTRTALEARAMVVWLRADVPFLLSRLKKRGHRPLLDDDPAGVLDRMVTERTHLYQEVADIVVDVEPFHRDHEKPKRALALRIAELVRSAEVALALRPTEDSP